MFPPHPYGFTSLFFFCRQVLEADHVLVAMGLEPTVDLAETSGLEVDTDHGGLRADAELRTRTDVWVVRAVRAF